MYIKINNLPNFNKTLNLISLIIPKKLNKKLNNIFNTKKNIYTLWQMFKIKLKQLAKLILLIISLIPTLKYS
jgi:hypothetical protein